MARRTPLKVAAALAVGTGMVAIGAIAGINLAGRRVRERVDPEGDRLLPAPDDVTHRSIPTRDGGSIHVAERGSGQPLLLMHGVTLQWWVWGAQFNTLSERYRVIAWDMRGHGRSHVGTDGVTLEAVADDIAAVLDGLDLRDALVVGHSMGGMALGRFCTRHPDVMVERCAGLMFLDTSAAPLALPTALAGAEGLQELVRRAAYAGTSRPRSSYSWPDTPAAAAIVRTAFGRHPSGTAVEDVRQMLAEMDRETLLAAGRTMIDHDVRRDLAHVAIPAMVVVGGADLLTSPRHARELADAIPGAVMHVLPGVGHQTMQEAPERFGELIDELAAMSA